MPVHTSEEGHQIVFPRDAVVAVLPESSFRFLIGPSFFLAHRHGIRLRDVKVGLIEMLPGITHHGIHPAPHERKFLIIVHIEIEQEVTTQAIPRSPLADVLEIRIQGSLRRTRMIETAACTLRHIVTQVQVNTKFLEAMNLVIQLQVAQTASGSTLIIILFQHGQRIHARQRIRIVGRSADGLPRPVAVVASRFVPYRFGGVEESRSTHCPTFGKAGPVDGSFQIQIDRQMLIPKFRADIESGRIAVVVRSTEGTFLGVDTHRNTERQESYLSGHTEVLVGSHSGAEYFVLPVGSLLGILAGHALCSIAQGGSKWILTDGCFAEFIRSHHTDAFIRVFHRKRTGILYLDAVLRPLLGGNDDDPIRGSGAIDGRSRRILQHGECLDIMGIEGGQRIGCARCGIIRHGDTVYHYQRVVAGIQRGPSTDTDTASGTGLSVGSRYIKSGNLSLNQLLRRGDSPLVHVLGLDGHHRTAQIVLLRLSVTYHHHFVQPFRVFGQGDVHDRLCRQFLCPVPDERNHQHHISIRC